VTYSAATAAVAACGALDFAVRRFLMKLFKTGNNDVIQDSCNFLQFSLPSDLLAVRHATFSNRYRMYKKLHWYFGLKYIDITLL